MPLGDDASAVALELQDGLLVRPRWFDGSDVIDLHGSWQAKERRTGGALGGPGRPAGGSLKRIWGFTGV